MLNFRSLSPAVSRLGSFSLAATLFLLASGPLACASASSADGSDDALPPDDQGEGGDAGDAGAAGEGNAGQGGASGKAGSSQGGKAGAAAGTGGKAGGSAGTGGSGGSQGGKAGAAGVGGGTGCGDGVRQAPNEQCDGNDLAGQTCALLFGAGYAGTLTCKSTCQLNTANCMKQAQPAACGDGKVNQAIEECDGGDFAGNSCAKVLAMPNATGTLSCDSSCKLIKSGCNNGPVCGDGKKDTGEDCDGSDIGKATCASATGNANKGGTLSCSATCTLDTSQCVDNPVCGDGKKNTDKEKCDGADLGGATCQNALGTDKATGTLACTKTCYFDTSGCTVPAYCGDGIKNADDECDGTDFGTDTCESKLGKGHAGKLSCSGDCKVSTASCMVVPYCGDGAIDPGEKCDGAALGADATCDKIVGFMSTGTVSCGADCAYDTTMCTPPQLCGNGKIDAGEDCDGALLGSGTCATALGDSHAVGTVSCNSSCKYDTAACTIGPYCGNGKLDAGEECDDGNTTDDGNGCSKKCKVSCAADEYQRDTHCYGEYYNDYSWDDAEAYCESYGGHLVTIADQSEFDFVLNEVFDQSFLSDTSPRWIGFNDKATEGTFQWVTGEPVLATAWNSGEPNNSNGNEDCVEMKWSNGSWNDQNCSTGRIYVCEYEPVVKFP